MREGRETVAASGRFAKMDMEGGGEFMQIYVGVGCGMWVVWLALPHPIPSPRRHFPLASRCAFPFMPLLISNSIHFIVFCCRFSLQIQTI